MAGWIDGQLSPGEHELMEAHLRRCPSCRALAEAMADQPLYAPQHAPLPPGFWDSMDDTLNSELADELSGSRRPERRAAPTPAPAVPVWQRTVRMSPLAMAAYAALLVGAVGWGLYSHSALQDSRAETADLQQQLEREMRLAGQPLLTTPKGYRTPTNRTNRGTL